MKDRTKMVIIGATVAASAAVPAIASAGSTSNAATKVESTHAKSVPPAATPTTVPTGAASPIESSDAAEDAAEVDVPATGTDVEKATAAALAHVGEGRVTGTEIGDEESYYEIEITLDDGTQLDVQLDEQFNYVSSEDDGVGSDD